MFDDNIDESVFDRYLDILGVSRKKLSLGFLSELVAAHLIRVPFENISKLYYRKKYNLRNLPGLKKYLDGIEQFHFGGTCYSNNYYLYLLLEHLGFDIKLCGADMANPDVHLVSIVRVEGREYIVDVGYAAPFLSPLPRDIRKDYEIRLGHDRYVLKPRDNQGRSKLELYRDGVYKHGYKVKPMARSIEHFADAIAHSYTDQATFTNAILLVRFLVNSSITIFNLKLIESEGLNQKIRQLADRHELAEAIEGNFGIPTKIATEAINELGELKDAWT
jgi:N-hydroxyarylamine O-acetyltransferase